MLAESGACYFLLLYDLGCFYPRCRSAYVSTVFSNLRLLWTFADLLLPAEGGIAALAAFLIEKTTASAVVLVLFISSFQKIVDADAIKISERAQNMRRQHSFATLVICVCALRNIDCFADLTLCQISVFPQIADAPVSFHVYHQIQYM